MIVGLLVLGFMNQKRNKILCLFILKLLIFFSIIGHCIAAEKIKVGYYELPPYISAELERYGIVGLIFEKALENQAVLQYIAVPAVRLPYLLNSEEIMVGTTTIDNLCANPEYKCSEAIKAISVILAYKAESNEFDNVASLEELKTHLNDIGQTKENILFDAQGKQIKFREIRNIQQGLDLLAMGRLKGVLMNEEVFDFKTARKEINLSVKKTKNLTLVPLRIIVKSNSKYQWIIKNIDDYMQKNTYDKIWFDYYVNSAVQK